MTTQLQTGLTAAVDAAARTAGMKILSAEAGTDFNGAPTARLTLGLAPGSHEDRTLTLELSDKFDFSKPELLPEMTRHLQESARRLHNPRPDCYVSLGGLPISYGHFQWPFHRSTSGSDTYVVHGEVKLEDGHGSPLHARISASMTVTFAEIVPAPEQPYAEGFIYNAVRKTLDRGQMEMLKSGNRQPVPVTMRYYSRWQHKFVFTDTTDETRMDFLALKIYWLSGVQSGNEPVWIADPYDAQYLNTDVAQLQKMAAALAGDGLLRLADGGEYASATPALMSLASEYQDRLQEALDFTKPTFNEEMRAGHTNM
jgi:hypothetical protein